MKRLRRWLSWSPILGERQLVVPVAGRYVLVLSVALGVVAIATRNPLLYLLESFLLAALLVSGVYAEFVLRALKLSWTQNQAIAGEPTGDWIELTNSSLLPMASVKVGFWDDEGFKVCCELPYLPARSTAAVRSQFVFSERGEKKFWALGVASGYPFGLAERRRLYKTQGHRWVWPRKLVSKRLLESQAAVMAGSELKFGELRPFLSGDLLRDVAWTKSHSGRDWVVKPRGYSQGLLRMTEPDVWSEKQIESLAALFYSRKVHSMQILGLQPKHLKTSQAALQFLAELPR